MNTSRATYPINYVRENTSCSTLLRPNGCTCNISHKDGDSSSDCDDDSELVTLKGDAIGDTVYSARYVIKVLMELTEFEEEKWNDDLELDLCVLWDMAATPSVVIYIMNLDCLNIIFTVFQNTSNPRLLEILVGLLGNMCCVKEVRDVFMIDDLMCDIMLQLLSCPDPQTLIQVTRCYQSFTWDLLKGDATLLNRQHWFEEQIMSGEFASQLAFILSSSLNENLLMAVLDLLNTLCGLQVNDKDYSRYFATTEMVDGMLECWRQLFLGCKIESKFEFTCKRLEKSAHQWVSVLLAFAGQEAGREVLGEKSRRIVAAVANWIQEPEDSSDVLLVTTISLLEALVSYHFCQETFCKTLRIVRKTTEKSAVAGSSQSTPEDLTVLSLKESFGNFCVEVLKCVDRKVLDSILMECCNANSIMFFWRIVEEREPGCLLPCDKSR